MRKSVLHLTTKKRRGKLPEFVATISYLDDQTEAREALKGLQKYDLLWLEPASEIYYFESGDIAAITEFVRSGGGLLVTGGIGTGFLFRTALEEMLPATAVLQEDKLPQMSVRDIKNFADSVWYGSGEIAIDDVGGPILRNTGLKDGMRLKGGYISMPKPGSSIVARFSGYEQIATKVDGEPELMPFISTWAWYGGRAVYVTADPEMLPRGVDFAKLLSNIVRHVRKKPDAHETNSTRLRFCHGMMLRSHKRLEAMQGTDAEPARDEFRSLRDSIVEKIASIRNHSTTPSGAIEEIESAVREWGDLIDGMEAEVFRSAFEAYREFYRELAQAEVDGSLDEVDLKWLAYEGQRAKLAFNARAYIDAAKQYAALSRTISGARCNHSKTGCS